MRRVRVRPKREMTMKPLFLFTGICLLASSTFAQDGTRLPLLSIKSEFFPTETFYIGFTLNANRSLTSIYFEDDTKRNPFKEFAIQNLTTPQVMIQAHKYFLSFDVVKISFTNSILHVSYRQDVRQDLWSPNRDFAVHCDSKMIGCSVTDLSNNHGINSAYISAHKDGDKTVGIEKITSN